MIDLVIDGMFPDCDICNGSGWRKGDFSQDCTCKGEGCGECGESCIECDGEGIIVEEDDYPNEDYDEDKRKFPDDWDD